MIHAGKQEPDQALPAARIGDHHGMVLIRRMRRDARADVRCDDIGDARVHSEIADHR